MDNKQRSASTDLEGILESARRLGVEIDEEEALQWLAAMASSQAGEDDIVVDVHSGVFSHKVSMLDFNPEDLAHFRSVGRLIEFEDIPGVVETALALSGLAAKSKIQTYPGDADYFERVNILAESREQACLRLAGLIQEKALTTEKGPTYQLMEVKFGSYPDDVIKDGRQITAKSPISWSPEEVRAGQIEAAKIMELLQWLTSQESIQASQNPDIHLQIADELADVIIYCLSLANQAGVDISRAVRAKLARNESRFPLGYTPQNGTEKRSDRPLHVRRQNDRPRG